MAEPVSEANQIVATLKANKKIHTKVVHNTLQKEVSNKKK
jgi:hypothetical protein